MWLMCVGFRHHVVVPNHIYPVFLGALFLILLSYGVLLKWYVRSFT